VHSPFTEKSQAPRQGVVAGSARATIEILAEYEHALADLEGFNRIWVLFWFDRVHSTSVFGKVLPPRSDRKRGVFATRSPHRPNPIGMSAVVLERVEGLTLHVRDVDMLDGTPVLDLKPYLAYADVFPDANAGWLDKRDPVANWVVTFTPAAETELAFIAERASSDAESSPAPLDLRRRIENALALGPEPHPYRRIKRNLHSGELIVAVKDWRVRFAVSTDRSIEVQDLSSGYRRREIEQGRLPVHALHREFISRFGPRPL